MHSQLQTESVLNTRAPSLPCPRQNATKKPKVDVEAMKHIKLLNRTTQQYHVNINMCQSLLADIQSNAEWSWANNEELLQYLNAKKDNLETHMQSDEILRVALAEEPTTTLRNLPGFDNRIKALCATMEEQLAALRDALKKWRKMHAVHMQC